jgi:hypothetical protein
MNIRLEIKPEPDGFGYYYGEAIHNGEVHAINLMPPKAQWRGQLAVKDHGPHPTDWVGYVAGEEVARGATRLELEMKIVTVLQQGLSLSR